MYAQTKLLSASALQIDRHRRVVNIIANGCEPPDVIGKYLTTISSQSMATCTMHL